jgi:hypothetical protein
MAKEKQNLSEALYAELKKQRDLVDGALAPARGDQLALTATRAEIGKLAGENEDFEANGNPDDAAALQAYASKKEKIGILERRAEAAEKRIDGINTGVAGFLDGLQAAVIAAHVAHRDAHVERLLKLWAPVFLQDGHARQAVMASDFVMGHTNFIRGNLRLNMEFPAREAVRAVELADRLLAGEDLWSAEMFAAQKSGVMGRIEKANQAQEAAEAAAERENAALANARAGAKSTPAPAPVAAAVS